MPESSESKTANASSSSSSTSVAIYASIGTVAVVGVVASIVVAIVVVRRRRNDNEGRTSTVNKSKKPRRMVSEETLFSSLGNRTEDHHLQIDLMSLEMKTQLENRQKQKERAKVEFQEKLHSILDHNPAKSAQKQQTPQSQSAPSKTRPTQQFSRNYASLESEGVDVGSLHRCSSLQTAKMRELTDLDEQRIKRLSDLESDLPLLATFEETDDKDKAGGKGKGRTKGQGKK